MEISFEELTNYSSSAFDPMRFILKFLEVFTVFKTVINLGINAAFRFIFNFTVEFAGAAVDCKSTFNLVTDANNHRLGRLKFDMSCKI